MATKKKKTTQKYCGHFPVPVQSATGLQPAEHLWNYYDGIVDTNKKCVTISCNGDAHMLTSMGSFGTNATNSDGNEMFWLSLEEAFFLSYGLGCLFVSNEGQKLDILQQWRLYCSINSTFPIIYTAYHHFRTKNWVPKDGLKFGSHFILYKHGPQFFHSSYAVVLQSMNFNGQFLEGSSSLALEKVDDWWKLAGMNRLCSTVAKELLICSVLVPDNVEEIINSPECVRKFMIKETVVKRWVASKDRENEVDKNLL